MSRSNLITAIQIVLEAARAAGDFRHAQRCLRALRRLGAEA